MDRGGADGDGGYEEERRRNMRPPTTTTASPLSSHNSPSGPYSDGPLRGQGLASGPGLSPGQGLGGRFGQALESPITATNDVRPVMVNAAMVATAMDLVQGLVQGIDEEKGDVGGSWSSLPSRNREREMEDSTRMSYGSEYEDDDVDEENEEVKEEEPQQYGEIVGDYNEKDVYEMNEENDEEEEEEEDVSVSHAGAAMASSDSLTADPYVRHQLGLLADKKDLLRMFREQESQGKSEGMRFAINIAYYYLLQ